MKVLKVVTDNEESRFPLDVLRAQHIARFDSALAPGAVPPAHHIPHYKWLLVVELRPIKSLDHEGRGQVVDFVQMKEWIFNTHNDARDAVTVEEV